MTNNQCFQVFLLVSCLTVLCACQPGISPTATTALHRSQTAQAVNPIATLTVTKTPLIYSTVITDGQRIDIGGRKLWLLCTGQGTPTVILEAGLGADHTAWARVQPDAAQLTRVCSYDRAALGQSDPAPTPRTSQQVVDDLHTLLTKARIPGPYILVGHSFGGLHVRLYANQHHDEVLGIVLVDAVHEDWWKRAASLLPAAQNGERAALTELRRYFSSEGGTPDENAEKIDIARSAAQVRQSGDLGKLPVIVLTAGVPDLLPSNLPLELQTPLVNLLQKELPAALVKLSPNSMEVTVPNSGHDIPNQRPDVIVVAIKTLIQVSRGQ